MDIDKLKTELIVGLDAFQQLCVSKGLEIEIRIEHMQGLKGPRGYIHFQTINKSSGIITDLEEGFDVEKIINNILS